MKSKPHAHSFAAKLLRASAIALFLSAPALADDELKLPDFGRSANAGVSEREEYYYGLSVLREMRNAGVILDDPQVEEYFRTLGARLSEASEKPDENFSYAVLKNDDFNAFAVPGGVIGVHTGLILQASSESELAAVLSHEVAHVTQKHIVRAMERAQKASIPVMLGTLAVAAAAAQADRSDRRTISPGQNQGTISGVEAALIGGSALMQQLQINFTRDNEFEADRIGIQTLKKAGFDVTAMAGMFSKMQSLSRTGSASRAPQYLQTHPITVTRISEAKSRAENLIEKPTPQKDLPYQLIRERVRALKQSDPSLVLKHYQNTLIANGKLEAPAVHYGYAVTLARLGKTDEANEVLKQLRGMLAGEAKMQLTLALLDTEIAIGAKDEAKWRAQFKKLLVSYPKHRVVGASYAQALIDLGSKKGGDEALEVLRDLVSFFDTDPALYEQLGRAYELSGDKVRAGEAFARAAAYRGALEDALGQLQTISRNRGLSYYERARVDAQIAELTPIVLEIQKREGEGATRRWQSGSGPASAWGSAILLR
jgi:beta-barrel assembly-enhancing protease